MNWLVLKWEKFLERFLFKRFFIKLDVEVSEEPR
jgi:hypothetical protein